MAERTLELWRELRFVAKEIGLEAAERLPVEVRRWWIDQINKDIAEKRTPEGDGTRTVPVR